MNKFFIQDLNFEKDIGANSILLEVGPFKFVIDAGMDPKQLGNKALPNFDVLEPNSIDFIALTHCHLDHLGGLPILAKKQPQAHASGVRPAGTGDGGLRLSDRRRLFHAPGQQCAGCVRGSAR